MEPINNEEKKAERAEVKETKVVTEVHHHHYGRGTSFGSVFFGVLLIFFGFLYFARGAGWINPNINLDLSSLWPLLLILAGLSMLSRGGWVGGLIALLVTLIVIGIFGAVFFGWGNGMRIMRYDAFPNYQLRMMGWPTQGQ